MNKFIATIVIYSFFVVSVQAKLVNSIVGEVAGEPVTGREVLINFVLEQGLFPQKKIKRQSWELEINGKGFSSQVTEVLLEKVIFFESRNFSLANVSMKNVKSSYVKIMSKIKGWKYWRDLGVGKEELNKLIERKLRSKRFIRFRVESTIVPITDLESYAYFEKNRAKFGSLPFESLKKNINAFLSRENSNRRLRDWLSVLKRKYKVRSFVSES